MENEDIKQRGLIHTGRYLPYNPDLVERARKLRKNMTPAERILWERYLRKLSFRVLRQRPIDNYIVDFYCPFLKLVIEIDGEQHYSEEGKQYDNDRDGILASYGLKVIRIKNKDIIENLYLVCKKIEGFMKRSPL